MMTEVEQMVAHRNPTSTRLSWKELRRATSIALCMTRQSQVVHSYRCITPHYGISLSSRQRPTAIRVLSEVVRSKSEWRVRRQGKPISAGETPPPTHCINTLSYTRSIRGDR